MYPNQPNQSGYPPQRPTPQAGPSGSAPLREDNGQYVVLPPLANTPGINGHNPYEFIMSPNSKSGIRLGRIAFGKQIAIIIGGAVLLIIIMAIAFSAFAPKSNTASVLAVAERQQEIIRIAGGSSSSLSSGSSIQNFVVTTNVTVISDQNKTLSYLATHSVKPSTKTLALDHDTKTDSLLVSAQAAGTYDVTIAQTLQDQLNTYEKELQTAYKASTSTTSKQLLQKTYTNTQVLLQQANSIVSAATASSNN